MCALAKIHGNMYIAVMKYKDSKDFEANPGGDLFPEFIPDEPQPAPDQSQSEGDRPAPRVREPLREQVFLRPVCLEDLVGADHLVRLVWDYVGGLDLSGLYRSIKAVQGHGGRAATDPKMLLSLWLFATLEGVGSARALERLCNEHVAYQWLCGGVNVNYHTLADFRVRHEAVLDALLTESVAVLMAEGLVKLDRVAQDGMRVRASAGAASFRRGSTLKRCLKQAQDHIQRLRDELEQDPAATTRRQKAARDRAASDRLSRVQKALRRLPGARAKKKTNEKGKARVSTTDADATVMKMADGGFRPAFNVQFAADTHSQVIVGVDVSTSGSDQGQMMPMVEQLVERYHRAPRQLLVDGGFTKKEDIEWVSKPDLNCTVFAPVPTPRVAGIDPHQSKPDDRPSIAEWRRRMGTAEAKRIYLDRAATVECVNAIARNRGLLQFRVRGQHKARAVALLFALAHNLRRTLRLQHALATQA